MNDLMPHIQQYLDNVLTSLGFFMPEIYLTVLFLLVIITDLAFGKNAAWICKIVACAGLLFVIGKDTQQLAMVVTEIRFPFREMLMLHRPGVISKLIIDFLAIILMLYFSWDEQLKLHKKGLADLYSITIASIFGLHLMVMSFNLLSVFLSVELVSIASYLMVAYRSENGFSAEAGLKYVLFGAASSAIMLYGISLLYGFAGTLSLYDSNFIINLLQADGLAVSVALVLFLVGLGFKLSFVPLHFWVPDVYEGAATPVTAYLSTVPKIAGFLLLINFLTPFISYGGWNGFDFRLILSIAGIITMTVGNFAAVWQTSIKRMLAYSSIGHTGFALMAVVTFSAQGITSLIYYLSVYALANIGALALATWFTNRFGAENVKDYKGLGIKYPVASSCFVIILISLTGIPVTAGFTGKLFVFSAVYQVYQHTHNSGLMLLLITGAATTVVSLFYYIKIPLNLFLKKPDRVIEGGQLPQYNLIVLAVLISLALVLLGLFPEALYQYL
jgi:NADH-quinone oxidoreductase subunit N